MAPNSQMQAVLDAGLDVLDQNQTITFVLYQRLVLPADGFVFWAPAAALRPGALPGLSQVNSATPNATGAVTGPASVLVAQGSLHHATSLSVEEDETRATMRMVFTSKGPVNDLAAVGPDQMYLATVAGNRYAFSSRGMYYRQADLYHYSGDVVYPALATQIIDSPAQLRQLDVVASNSIPIWLQLASAFPLFPSYLVPQNQAPPYGAVHIGEDDTTPLQADAAYDQAGSRWQLVRDVVTVTTYGVRNDGIMDWLDEVRQYSLDNPSVMGVMNSPVPRDAKRAQPELGITAQKKVITFYLSYYQARMRTLAQQYITQAFIEDFAVPPEVSFLTRGS